MNSPRRLAFALALAAALASSARAADVPPIHVVIFTHVEDNTPGGMLGTTQSRQNYLMHRSALIGMAALAEGAGVPWTLQPDWKLLEAALLYEDSSLTSGTNGKNFLRHLKEDRGVTIDPHSHENGGYNYTDVAHLLDSLGVGATTVIGGHIWDPALPEFQEWDRFRAPVAGERYPGASWRGDILIGSGTPNHVNDPVISGLWRPRDRDHYFEHDSSANIVAVGSYKKSISSISELIGLYRSGTVPPTAMLTFSTNIAPSALTAPGGLAAIADTVFAPIVAWHDSGLVAPTDFTSMVQTWQSQYSGVGYLYDAEASTVGIDTVLPQVSAVSLSAAAPNPVRSSAVLRYSLARAAEVRVAVFDLLGREVAVLAQGPHAAGDHSARWDAGTAPCGAYVCRVAARWDGGGSVQARKILVLH